MTYIKKANFAGKVIEVSELTLDVGGAVYAALTTSAKTDFWFDREQEAYLSFKSPTAGAVVNPKSVRLEWELLRGKKVAEIRYEVSIKATQADGQIKQKVFADLVESTLLLDLITELKAEDIVSVQCKVTAKHARNSSNIIAESDNETFVVGAAPIDVPEGVVIENNILRKWPCDKIPADGKVVIPNGVVRIDYDAFNGCNRLTTIIIPNTVNSIGPYAFYRTGLTSVKLPKNIRVIEEGLFRECEKLISVSLPEGVINIMDNAFQSCNNLRVINLPQSIVSIGKSAFENCSSLGAILIPTGMLTIQDKAFKGCSSLRSMSIPSSVKNIGSNAFENCSSLSIVTLSSGVENIGNAVFMNCTSLTSITLPSTIDIISESMFRGCNSLAGISIPDNIRRIENQAFYGCRSLVSVTIPNGVTSIEYSAFSSCSSLMSITFSNSVTSIGSSAFASCSSLTSVLIPNSVTSIKSNAFSNCKSLVYLTLSNSMSKIETNTFAGCSSITTLVVPSNIKVIEQAAFKDCTSLTSVTIKSVTPIDIQKHISHGWGNYTYGSFHNAPLRTIKVPANSVDAYKIAESWSEYTNKIISE
ncbi:leucine-rich repeat domain-containing protein [Capnocytophaga canimorsus]|uniref:leucine-rich repeat domain-containing protein n=1 Tax=Capnocytophaga canimorsus TaxID=28188 RepID=UPI0037D61FBF